MTPLHQLTEEHKAALKSARDKLKPCPECQGKPLFRYEPGATFTKCIFNSETCPCADAVADFDLDELTDKINRKNVKDKARHE